MPSTSAIQPITRRFPASADVWHDTNLPLSVVLVPLADDNVAKKVHSLAEIPKCLHCGAPHANSTTHFRPRAVISSSTILLCYLCGRVSSTSSRVQQEERLLEGPLEESLYSRLEASADTFRLPLRLPSTTAYTVDAMMCPLLWFIVLDGSVADTAYWSVVSRLLSSTLADVPDHVHVALLVAGGTDDDDLSEDDTIGLVDLSSPVPHVRHYRASTEDLPIVDHLTEGRLWQAHWPTALRALMDYAPPPAPRSSAATTLAAILQALPEQAQPAGQRGTAAYAPWFLPYAGGKITCLLGNRPAQVCREDRYRQRAPIGRGGFGGRVKTQERFRTMPASSNHRRSRRPVPDTETGAFSPSPSPPPATPEWTPAGLQELEPFADVAEYFDELGRQCAQAALGVDLLFLLDVVPDLGLPLWSQVSLKSGAPGPLLFDRHDEASMAILQREVLARTPWQPGLVFGAELRLRLPPGFVVDDAAVEGVAGEVGPQLAPLYTDHGLLGGASSVDESTQLWRMGVADRHTAVTVDLAVEQRHVPQSLDVQGFGQVALQPVIQTCFAYTTVIERNGQYQTVRHMKIHSCPVPLASQTEQMYRALDPEALSVVLFHKLALASFQDGLPEATSIAQDWLQSTLMSVYQSAERYVEGERQHKEQENGSTTFFANERLLDREGELSETQVLLAQGHERLRTLPLLTYLLIQCDAFRLQPCSLDLRYAALAQMMSMTPNTLARCIAPRLQLWSSAKDETEPILDILDLRMEAIKLAVLEYSETNDLILFLDAPDQIVVMDGQYLLDAKPGSASTPRSLPLVMGTTLKVAIQDAAQSYRTAPPIVMELSYDPAAGDRVLDLLRDSLIEDVPSAEGHANFAAWSRDMAQRVRSELEKD